MPRAEQRDHDRRARHPCAAQHLGLDHTARAHSVAQRAHAQRRVGVHRQAELIGRLVRTEHGHRRGERRGAATRIGDRVGSLCGERRLHHGEARGVRARGERGAESLAVDAHLYADRRCAVGAHHANVKPAGQPRGERTSLHRDARHRRHARDAQPHRARRRGDARAHDADRRFDVRERPRRHLRRKDSPLHERVTIGARHRQHRRGLPTLRARDLADDHLRAADRPPARGPHDDIDAHVAGPFEHAPLRRRAHDERRHRVERDLHRALRGHDERARMLGSHGELHRLLRRRERRAERARRARADDVRRAERPLRPVQHDGHLGVGERLVRHAREHPPERAHRRTRRDPRAVDDQLEARVADDADVDVEAPPDVPR